MCIYTCSLHDWHARMSALNTYVACECHVVQTTTPLSPQFATSTAKRSAEDHCESISRTRILSLKARPQSVASLLMVARRERNGVNGNMTDQNRMHSFANCPQVCLFLREQMLWII